MVEYFPGSSHEDSDDDSSPSNGASKKTARHESSQPVEQSASPKEQEGTIFSRADFAPNLSRPLFDFIRKQEQSEVRSETTSPVGPDFLPSVSVPSDPEVRTYRPPSEVGGAEMQGEQSDDEDEDEEEEAEDQVRSTAPAATTPKTPSQSHELQRPLNEQFEAIMRGEMGEDFSRLTSGEQLGEVEPESVTIPGPATVSEGPRRFDSPPVPEWRPPGSRPSAQEWAEPEPVMRPMATHQPVSVSSYSSPTSPGESSAFYYSEAEPDTPLPSDGEVPPTAPFANALGGMRSPDTPLPASAVPVEAFGAAPAHTSERQEKHNGRWFAAGFITGWVIKQHLANKKLSRFRQASEQEIGQRDEKLDALALDQQTLQRRVKRSESQLQETYVRQRRAESSAQLAGAERPIMSGGQAMEAATEQPVAPSRQSEASVAQQARAESAFTTPQGQVLERRSTSPLMEAPLQQSGVAETMYSARPSIGEAAPTNRQRVAEIIPEPQPETAPQNTTEADATKAYELQSGQHIEHATGGGHNIIVDKHGHEVQNAIEYGEEFQFQRRQEQARATTSSTSDSTTADADSTSATSSGAQEYNLVTGLDSGQVDLSHSLSPGPPSPTTRQHLLNSRHDNPVIATIVSPWLWAALVVLLLAFFVAAFI